MPRLKRLVAVAVVVGVVLAPEPGLAAIWRVNGASMEPELHDGSMVIVDQVGPALHGYRRGDVVILEPPGDEGRYPMSTMIKRVVGLPGERVTVAGARIRIDGRSLHEPYLRQIGPRAGGAELDIVVPDDAVFVMGDHRGESFDSTAYGPVPIDQLHGRVLLILGPDRITAPTGSPLPHGYAAR